LLKLSRKGGLSENQCTFPVCLEVFNDLILKDVGMFIDELENDKPRLRRFWESPSLVLRVAFCEYRGQAFHGSCGWVLLEAVNRNAWRGY